MSSSISLSKNQKVHPSPTASVTIANKVASEPLSLTLEKIHQITTTPLENTLSCFEWRRFYPKKTLEVLAHCLFFGFGAVVYPGGTVVFLAKSIHDSVFDNLKNKQLQLPEKKEDPSPSSNLKTTSSSTTQNLQPSKSHRYHKRHPHSSSTPLYPISPSTIASKTPPCCLPFGEKEKSAILRIFKMGTELIKKPVAILLPMYPEKTYLWFVIEEMNNKELCLEYNNARKTLERTNILDQLCFLSSDIEAQSYFYTFLYSSIPVIKYQLEHEFFNFYLARREDLDFQEKINQLIKLNPNAQIIKDSPKSLTAENFLTTLFPQEN